MPPIKTIYDLGFDKLLNKSLTSISSGLVYDPIGSSLNTAQMLTGGQLTLKSLSIGGLVKQVAPGDDIQAAINAVNREGGGTVQLLAGTYLLGNNIEVKSNVTLAGGGIGNTVIDFNAGAFQVFFQGTARTVGGTGVTITEGLATVTGIGGTTFLTDVAAGDILFLTSTLSGAFAEVSSITSNTVLVLKKAWAYPTVTDFNFVISKANSNGQIKNLTITNSSESGANQGVLHVERAINFLAENVLVYANTAAVGVRCNSVINSEFRNVESSYNGDDTADHGFSIDTVKRVSFYNCSALGNAGDGFTSGSGYASEGNTFYSCFAEGNTGNGFDLSDRATLFSCRSMGNDGDGYELNGIIMVISGCSAIDNGADGIEVTATGDSINIRDCFLRNNDAWGIDILASGSQVVISKCFYSGNASGTVRNAGTNNHYDNTESGTFTAVNGANNNIATTTTEARFIRISGPTAAFSISGIANGINGKTVILYNSVAFDMTITNDATSTAANRILTLTGADVVLTGVSSATFIYNLTDARWILVGTSG